MKNISQNKLYRIITDVLEKKPLPRTELLSECISEFGISPEEQNNKKAGSYKNIVRSRFGECINEMHEAALIGIDKYGRYYLISERPVIVRIEKCEKEIIKALTERPHNQKELRDRLISVIGTDKTATRRDDDILSTYIGQLLKKLISYGTIILSEGSYSLSEKVSAKADNINEMLSLKSDFIERIHKKGGEFFENYFMSLISKYSVKHGKKVLECYVTGGSADGGIDGIIKTEDSLGFIEITMVQTKNKLEIATETDIRGFYGAVCAKKGTRGIYATTSDFHINATSFLSQLDDCIGIGGDKIFSMAIECQYGIKKQLGHFVVDSKII